MHKPKLVILALGGTIAMVPGDAGGVKPGLSAADLAAAVPGLDRVATLRFETLSKIASPSLTFDAVCAVARRIEALAAAGEIDGAIVTQGTDTLEETAFLLDCLLDLDLPVIMIGAMRNPTMASPDGPGNLLAAARVAADPAIRAQARALGVLVVMLDRIHAALDVAKADGTRIDAFASPVTGPTGLLVEDRVRLLSLPLRPHKDPLKAALGATPAARLAGRDAAVGYLALTLGDTGALLRAVLDAPDRLGFAGMVLGLMGGGHCPDWLAEDVGRLAAAMPTIGAGRIGAGALLRSTYESAGTEMDLSRRGVVWAGRLHPYKARALLEALLRGGADRAAIARVFAALD